MMSRPGGICVIFVHHDPDGNQRPPPVDICGMFIKHENFDPGLGKQVSDIAQLDGIIGAEHFFHDMSLHCCGPVPHRWTADVFVCI